MDDLVTWLHAQLDDDERVAKRVKPNQAPTELRAMVTREGSEPFLVIDSARVLAEAEAKRRILDLWQRHWERADEPDLDWEEGKIAAHSYSALADAIRLLALPYADRPGYRDEWKP